MTYTEFLEWLEFLQWDEMRHAKADVYMAQIAAEIRRSNAKNPRRIRTQDFLLKQREGEDKQGSKKIWAAHLKINLQKN